jgi:Chaperone of endosialidase
MKIQPLARQRFYSTPLALTTQPLSNTTGINNTALGAAAGANITGSGNVCIGGGVTGEVGVDDSTYIGNVNTLTQNFSAGVNDYVTVRLSDGRLGHTAVVSSQRYKHDIKPLATTSEALYALKPVSFRLKKEFDATQALGFGLIAEEVEKVDPTLVYRNAKGQVESVRYEMVNAMLLNEFLKEHRKVEKLEATVADLAAQLQKVSAQVQMNNSATQVIVSNH